MNNYEAIMKMNPEQLSAFLDDVYCAGLNNGQYAARQPGGDDKVLDDNPFDTSWLEAEAEPATLGAECEDGDAYMLEALTASILRNAGVNATQTVTETDTKKTINIVMTKNN